MDGNKEILIDMPDNSDLKNDAFSQAKYAVENLKVESLVAGHLKAFFDSKYGPCWHCVAGTFFK